MNKIDEGPSGTIIGWIIIFFTVLFAVFGWTSTGHCENRISAYPRAAVMNHAPVNVRVTVLLDDVCDQWVLDWGDGSRSGSTDCPKSFQRVHAYREPGTFTVTATVELGGKLVRLETSVDIH